MGADFYFSLGVTEIEKARLEGMLSFDCRNAMIKKRENRKLCLKIQTAITS
jgi:hypothetical protein